MALRGRRRWVPPARRLATFRVGGRNERHTGDPGQPEEGPRRDLRQRPGQDPEPRSLAGQSLRFTRAYPESIPTLCARRAIHTGLRTWPFRNWNPPEGEDFMPAGWQHIPEDQTTLSEILEQQGFNTTLFSDTHHLFKASMNFQRGFRLFDWVRGQERDRYRPTMRVSQERVDQM